MSELENLGVNEPEVAEPDDTGVKEPEVAEPDVEEVVEDKPHKNTPHEAWAEMRKAKEEADRRAAEAERKVAEMEAAAQARSEAIKRLTGNENAEVNALAESLGLDPTDVMATLNASEVAAKKDLEIQLLKEQLDSVKVDSEIQKDLAEIQKIDPTIKSLNDLGETFPEYIKAGLTAEQAYYAIKGKEITNRVTPAKEIGKLQDSKPPEKDFFTEAEVAAMTSQERYDNAEKIMASLPKWKK